MSFYDFTTEENIQRYLVRLDQVEVEYESRWGVKKLHSLCSPEMQEKWNRHSQKLRDAVNENRINDVIDLVEGAIRAFKAMEDEALSRGHKMHDADMWDVKHPDSGNVYRVVKTNYDAGISLKDGARVYTLQEVSRLLESHDNLNAVKDVFPDSKLNLVYKNEDFNDSIPF